MNKLSYISSFALTSLLFVIPLISYAQFPNPIEADTIEELVATLLRAIVMLVTPFVVLFLMYAGWLFVTASGNEEKLTKAKTTFFWTLVGGVVVLGALAIAEAIEGTVAALGI